MALRWKKNPRPTGLRGVGAGPQGSTLHDGEAEYATVYPFRRHHQTLGWYWVARNDEAGVPLINTCTALEDDEASAKASALAYVRQHLAASQPKHTNNQGE